MFNLAVAIVAMSSALSLTSCDKFVGGNSDKDSETIVEGVIEGALTKDSLNNDSTGAAAATPSSEAGKTDAKDATATDTDKPAADDVPAADTDKASSPAEKK